MFSTSDKNKKDAFVSRSKAAREQRNLEKHQEKAVIKIQVNWLANCHLTSQFSCAVSADVICHVCSTCINVFIMQVIEGIYELIK